MTSPTQKVLSLSDDVKSTTGESITFIVIGSEISSQAVIPGS